MRLFYLFVLAWIMSTPALAAEWGTMSLSSVSEPDHYVVRVDLEPGWKIVRGMEQIDASPTDVFGDDQKGQVFFPSASRFSTLGLQGVGYQHRVTFGTRLPPGKKQLRFETVVCKTSCLPISLSWNIDHGFLLGQSPDAVRGWPTTWPDFPKNALPYRIEYKNHTLHFLSDQPLDDMAFEGFGQAGWHPSKISPYEYTVSGPWPLEPVRAWIWSKDETYEVILAKPVPPLVPILLSAFIGGVLLSCMPCVLPLLMLKASLLLRHNAQRWNILATAGGILLAFGTLALWTLLLKAWGLPFIWGEFFQYPAWTSTLMGIFFISTCCMGPVVLQTPRWAQQWTSILPKGLLGDFGGGVLLTVLALPCTAPFLGAALGLALAGPLDRMPWVIFSVGVGLAFPWILLATFPFLQHLVPKPGRWMRILKALTLLSFIMITSWMGYILWLQVGSFLFVLSAGVLMVGGMGMWRGAHPLTWASVLLASLIAVSLLAKTPSIPPPSAGWQSYTEQAWNAQAPELAIVEITANWCITCKVNRQIALESDTVQNALREVPSFQADMTTKNLPAQRLLQHHQRAGLPFVMVRGPRSPQGEVLPEVLTPQAVLNALERAR